MSKQMLKELLNVFEKEFPEAELLRPRSIKLDQFTYVNDEEADKGDEVELDETVVLEKTVEATYDSKSIQAFSKRIPLIAVDTSSSRLGETDEGLLYAFRASIVAQVNEKAFFSQTKPKPNSSSFFISSGLLATLTVNTARASSSAHLSFALDP